MCLASPGPRCHGHASVKAEKLEGQVQEAEAKKEEIKTALSKIAKKFPKNYASRHDYQQVQARLGLAESNLNSYKRKHKVAVEELDSTVGGIQDLKERIAALNPALDEEVQEHDELVNRLAKGEVSYVKKLRAYDYERGTVDGRNPSPYGSDKGIHILAKRKKDLTSSVKGLNGENEEKIAAINEQLAHARKTRDWASAGITDKASASLAANKEALKKSRTGLRDALKKQAEREKNYNDTYVVPMAELRDKHREEGKTLVVQWPLDEKRKLSSLRQAGDEYYVEFVKPSSYEVLKHKGIINHLESQIKLGSVSPKKRAESRNKRYHV
jgi:predicted  nucleic acid-binding Zn-ribbon protein